MQSIPHLDAADISSRVQFFTNIFGAKPAKFVLESCDGFSVTFSDPYERFAFVDEGLVLARLAYDGEQVGISATSYTAEGGEAYCFYFRLYQLGLFQKALATVSYTTTSTRTYRKIGIPTRNPLEFTSPEDARMWLEYMTKFFAGVTQAIE
ncbi:MAG: hypothetical protein HZA80_02440 [Candidatus Taylorbacteria bacterium]|nr:hypothetical protein [Candidatus Taylorbacteria bacterium]